ncbi:MAG TPA: hypothetical protein VN608_04205 [Clostridia bacterium]|nr:hypothetical protein [Clostridia bacterium]
MTTENTISRLTRAFDADGFTIKRVITVEDGLGAVAAHKTAFNYDTRQKKLCYYLEGTPYARGYVMGLMAEPQVAEMAVSFTDNIVFDFLNVDFLASYPFLPKLLVALLYEMSEKTWESQPKSIREEVRGIYEGCVKVNPHTKVTLERLVVMNIAFDVLCAIIYTGDIFRDQAPQAKPEGLKMPMLCNAFSAFRSAAGGGHYFARDFMFSSARVLQNNLAHIISVPEPTVKDHYPIVCLAAPGFVGSITAMNTRAVAGGVNMSPSGNCDVKNIGTNSLLLLRECILRGGNLREAASVISSTPRGVSWNYALSDGHLDRACAAETGASFHNTDALSYPPKELLPLLPDQNFLDAHPVIPVRNGLALRLSNASYQDVYLRINSGLWDWYKKERDKNIRLLPGAFLGNGFINLAKNDKNCPSNFYFAPVRTFADTLITGNHFISPELRLCAMKPWTARVTLSNVNDIQWRYDELNRQLRQTILKEGSISMISAKRIAEFLAPYGHFPKYYLKNPRSRDGKAVRIEGSVSVCDLKAIIMESHYGYYSDAWVKTTLAKYLG